MNTKSFEWNARKHFQKRIRERIGIVITDYEYYRLCVVASLRSIHSRNKGFVSKTNPDRVYMRISLRNRLFGVVFDCSTGLLITLTKDYGLCRTSDLV